jgi:hypothetical protein
MCSTGFCSNDTLAAVVSNITTGCASDLNSVNAGVPATLTQLVQQVYPTARSIMCLKECVTPIFNPTHPHFLLSNAANKLCVTETLQDLQDIIGQLSFTDLNLDSLMAAFQKVASGAANLACTNCTKAAFNLAGPITQQFPQAAQEIDSLCGSGFIGVLNFYSKVARLTPP